MLNQVHVFTSITSNYLPKARVLADSVKTLHPEVVFSVLLSDNPPDGFDLAAEPFDRLILIDDLDIPEKDSWIFLHSVVELCTAVKGFAFQYIMDQPGVKKVFYFDPDTVVFGRLIELSLWLDQHSVLLTPHQIDPDQSYESIADNEVASLKHGVFNLGFLAVNNVPSGRALIDWWAERLHHFCFDDIPGGLFTDQRWMDLAPCFFDDIRIIRDPGFNVATWNLSRRTVTGDYSSGFVVNKSPLGFYHFSGMDSGAQLIMLDRYAENNRSLRELRDWYIQRCEYYGQSQLGALAGVYDYYSDGVKITRAERLFYRERLDVRKRFPNPYMASDINNSYREWYRLHVGDPVDLSVISVRESASVRAVMRDVSVFINHRAEKSRTTGWFKRILGKTFSASLNLLVRFIR